MASGDKTYELKPPGIDDRDRAYWFAELRQRGMTLKQIDVLLEKPGTRFHDLCVALDAGCSTKLAFKIFR